MFLGNFPHAPDPPTFSHRNPSRCLYQLCICLFVCGLSSLDKKFQRSRNVLSFSLFYLTFLLFGRGDVASPNSERLVVQSFQKKQSENSVNDLMLPDTGYMSLCDQREGLISSLIIWELGQGSWARDQTGKHSLERLNIPLASDMLPISVACVEIWIPSEALRLKKKKKSTWKVPILLQSLRRVPVSLQFWGHLHRAVVGIISRG